MDASSGGRDAISEIGGDFFFIIYFFLKVEEIFSRMAQLIIKPYVNVRQRSDGPELKGMEALSFLLTNFIWHKQIRGKP